MLNRSTSFAMSTSVLEALPGKLNIKRHSPSILYIPRLNDASTQAKHSVYSNKNRNFAVCYTLAYTSKIQTQKPKLMASVTNGTESLS